VAWVEPLKPYLDAVFRGKKKKNDERETVIAWRGVKQGIWPRKTKEKEKGTWSVVPHISIGPKNFSVSKGGRRRDR